MAGENPLTNLLCPFHLVVGFMRSYLLSRLLLLLLLLQYYSRQFLEKVATKDLGYHVAVKDVKTEAGTVKGLKLEKFIFDAFPYAKKTCLLEVEREAEFAPVKNAFGADKDSPDTARALLMQLHRRWAEAAGATIEGSADEGLEISPLMSYAGENLEEWAGKTLKSGTMVQSGEPHVAILDDPSSPLIAPKAARTISQDSVGLSKLGKCTARALSFPSFSPRACV
mmetsp:Transcript_15647/g.39823  ORF Transcript_15647/g.39823 Transcript_15647/m.39823 type:complete len:225 (-) Transcript_15647:290-964(-)